MESAIISLRTRIDRIDKHLQELKEIIETLEETKKSTYKEIANIREVAAICNNDVNKYCWITLLNQHNRCFKLFLNCDGKAYSVRLSYNEDAEESQKYSPAAIDAITNDEQRIFDKLIIECDNWNHNRRDSFPQPEEFGLEVP